MKNDLENEVNERKKIKSYNITTVHGIEPTTYSITSERLNHLSYLANRW